MLQISYMGIGSKGSAKRLYIQGLRLEDAKFSIGQRYDFKPLADGRKGVEIFVSDTAKRKVSRKKRRNSDVYVPVMDIFSEDFGRALEGVERVRVVYFDGRAVVTEHHEDRSRNAAIASLVQNLKAGVVTEGTLFAGGGVSNRALHEGISAAGLMSKTAFMLEIDQTRMQMAYENSPAVDSDTLYVSGDVNEVEPETLPQVDILNISMPCVGFSVAGKSKNKIASAEEHSAGIAFIGALQIIKQVKPVFIVGENVKGYMGSVTETLVNSYLARLGYHIDGGVFAGNEYGALENRERHIWVAVLKGAEFALDMITPMSQKPATLGEVLEPIPDDSNRWKKLDYLALKEARDAANNKSFKRQKVTADSPKVGTIGEGYSKYRSTEPHLSHPQMEGYSRLLTQGEHEAVKGVPHGHTAGFSESFAHSVLGNSVIYPLFVSIGRALGLSAKWLLNSGAYDQAEPSAPAPAPAPTPSLVQPFSHGNSQLAGSHGTQQLSLI